MLDADALARLKAKINQASLKDGDIARYLNISPQAVSGWFSSGQITLENLIAVTHLVETTIDEIVSGNAHNLTEQEMKLLRKYRAATLTQQHQLEMMLDSFERQNRELIERYHTNAYTRQEYGAKKTLPTT